MKKITLLIIVILMVGIFFIERQYVSQQDSAFSTMGTAKSAEQTILYWYDPMKPDQHFDKPGKSPFMDMELIPKYATEPSTVNVGKQGARFRQAFNVRIGQIQADEQHIVWVPKEAIFLTGKKAFVFVAKGDGYFDPAEVVLGKEDNSRVEILQGLTVQQSIVLSAPFLIDAESNAYREFVRMQTQEPHHD